VQKRMPNNLKTYNMVAPRLLSYVFTALCSQDI
jgi:hypothetical protein